MKVSNSTVLFIDRNVANYSSLLEGINSEIAVFVLDTERDGISQITEILKDNNYQQVHIISHGAPGCLYLGNSQPSLDTLNKYRAELQSWYSTPLSKGGRGDLLIYGCQVAAGDAGEEFLKKLHQLTGANIAASSSLTGNEELGGNWNLEVKVGEVVADAVLTEASMANYSGVLDRVELVKDIKPGRGSSFIFESDFIVFNDKLYFIANTRNNGDELWVSDGTNAGTRLFKDILPGSESSSLERFTELNGKLYFSADNGVNGEELWISDGTTAGTQLLKDIRPGRFRSLPFFQEPTFAKFNGKLYFSADNGASGFELWVSDGTSAGTQLLKNINPGRDNSSSPENFTELNGKLYFSANDGVNGQELWVTDGTTAGTQLLKDINPGSSNSYPGLFGDLIELNGKLYFTANDGVNGFELWISDGTTAGTRLLKDINPGRNSLSLIDNFTKLNGKLYFTADDGVNGNELWVSDGTTAGTQLLKDTNPGSGYSSLKSFTEFNGKLYFRAGDDVNGSELWVTDGTSAGTQLFKDINPGSESSYPFRFTEFNGKLYFSANDGVHGQELWVTDGTSAGTQLVADINLVLSIRSGSSFPSNLAVVGDRLLFYADDGVNGQELWQLTVSNTITGTNEAERLIGTAENDNISGLAGNDTLLGRDGSDTLIGGNGIDSLIGGNGNDTLTGGTGSDILSGNSGNDFLDGGDGNDLLTGGAESDIFVLRAGNGRDSISDFQLGIDRLGLADGLTFEDLTFTNNRINFGTEVLATVAGINTENLERSDFILL
jgi:ELWxxDGT repeat protein